MDLQTILGSLSKNDSFVVTVIVIVCCVLALALTAVLHQWGALRCLPCFRNHVQGVKPQRVIIFGLQMWDVLTDVNLAAALERRCVASGDAATASGGDAVPPTRVFVLADTTFGSCCVDEVAAAHHACLLYTSPSPRDRG